MKTFFFNTSSVVPKTLPFFFFSLRVAFSIKKKYFSLTLSIVSTFLVHPFPSPFTVISLFLNTQLSPTLPFFLSSQVAFGNKKKKNKLLIHTFICLHSPFFSSSQFSFFFP